jgi:coproporphyrinogen III oxidase-like Fe-S oxidoreductase
MDSLPSDKRDAEILAFGMRTVDGWTWRQFAEIVGVDAKALRGKELARLERLGLVTIDDNGFRPTARGLLFNDDIVMELL